ncbi:MAG: nitrogen regulation protein NR(II) [Burkholderiales bacterium]
MATSFDVSGLDLLSTAVFLLGTDRLIRYVNPAAENLLGMGARSLVGVPPGKVFTEPGLLAGAIDYSMTHNCSYTQHDLQLSNARHSLPEVSCTVTPIEISALRGFLIELTPANQQLKIAREERLLDQSLQTRELIRNLAHEIKNPLGALRGAAQLLERELDRLELREYTQVIVQEADRLQSLLDRLLTPHRIPRPVRFNVHEALEQVARLLTAEFAQGLVVERDYDVSLPPVTADREQIFQALLNIGRNAAQAVQGKGRILLRSRVARRITLARQVHRLALLVQIIDDGPGVPENMKEKIFFPLVSGRDGGSGIGLTIAQTFITQHHGIIELESRPGRTCFNVLLPLDEGVH